jgi:hypothetical protein
VQWDEFSIRNYELVVKVDYGHKYEYFKEYMNEQVFTNNKCFVRELYEFEGFSILIFDISEWKDDIKYFLKGKYSKLSDNAKGIIKSYHTMIINDRPVVNGTINSCLYPDVENEHLDNMTPIEYAISHYIMDKYSGKVDHDTAESWRKHGELCSKCEFKNETLTLDTCKSDIFIDVE